MIELLEIEHECMLRKSHGDCDGYCCDCDLVQDDAELHEMYTDVIGLLQTHEPRVFTLEEARAALRIDRVIWVELKDIYLAAGLRMDDTDYFTMQNGDVLTVTDLDDGDGVTFYGKRVRFWSSCPNNELLDVTPWQE